MQMNERYELREHGKAYTFFNKLLKNPYILIAPAVIFDLWLTIYPMCFAIYMSFFKWDPISGRKKFLGLGNFRYLFQSADFRKVLSNTIIFMLAILFVGLFLKILISTSAPALLKASALSYSQLLPGNTGINTVGLATLFLHT